MFDIQLVAIDFRRGCAEQVEVVRLAEDSCRLEMTPLARLGHLWKGDVIRVGPRPDGVLKFRGVIERASMRHFSRIVSREFAESPALQEFLADVTSAGGSWERAFQGILIVHMPLSSPFEAGLEYERRARRTE